MSFLGLRVRRNNGSLQIDGRSPNVALTRVGTANFDGSKGKVRTATITAHRDDIVFYRPADGWTVKPCHIYDPRKEWQTYRLDSMPDQWPPGVKFWVYRRADHLTQMRRAGLIIRNPKTRAVIFNSAYRYMSIHDYVSPTENGNKTLRGNGRVLACMLMGGTTGANAGEPDNGFSGSRVEAHTDGGLTLYNTASFTGGFFPGLVQHPFLVADVTDHR